jgi:hypothetical protein
MIRFSSYFFWGLGNSSVVDYVLSFCNVLGSIFELENKKIKKAGSGGTHF